jgi:hypothetical protein
LCLDQYAEVSESLLSANPAVPTFFVLDQSETIRDAAIPGFPMRNATVNKAFSVSVEWGVMASGAISSSAKDKVQAPMGFGSMLQIRSAYSRTDRSEENLPIRATFRIDMRSHCAGRS